MATSAPRYITLSLFAALHGLDRGFVRRLARNSRLRNPDGSLGAYKAGPRAWFINPLANWKPRLRGGPRQGAGRPPKAPPQNPALP